jgi:radical SAM superfamily enzyme YgiQ (UPF0313 family)
MADKINLVHASTNIHMTGNFMMEYPAETREDIHKTGELAMKLPLHRAQLSNFLPLPGTEVYDRLIATGEIDPQSTTWDFYQNNRIVYTTKDISPGALRRMMRKAFAKFYFRPLIIKGLLKEIHSLNQLRTILRRFFDVFRYAVYYFKFPEQTPAHVFPSSIRLLFFRRPNKYSPSL